MSTRILHAVGVLLAVAFTWGVILLSAVPYRPHGTDKGALRLAWRMSSQGEEVCRPYTAEEIAALPVHMRREEICERPHATWELAVRLDDEVLVEQNLTGGGARNDGPISMLEEWPLEPGEYTLDVLFRRSDTEEGDSDWRRVEESIVVEPGGVHLVWIHPETGLMMLSH